MYEKWIADDSEDLKVTKDEIVALQQKIASVKSSQGDHFDALADKEAALQGKEEVLTVRVEVVGLFPFPILTSPFCPTLSALFLFLL